MDDEARTSLRDLLRQVTAAAARVPLALGFTVLGAGIVVGRELLRRVSSLLHSSGTDAQAVQHHAGSIRERALAAEQAARASGLLSPRHR